MDNEGGKIMSEKSVSEQNTLEQMFLEQIEKSPLRTLMLPDTINTVREWLQQLKEEAEEDKDVYAKWTIDWILGELEDE